MNSPWATLQHRFCEKPDDPVATIALITLSISIVLHCQRCTTFYLLLKALSPTLSAQVASLVL